MATIKEDYVSFETAKLLKEKGLDCPCHATYDTAVIGGKPKFYEYEVLSYFPYGMKNSDDKYSMVISAPTLQMAIKWLRETYNIHIVLSPNKKMNNQYCSIIFVDKEGELHPQPTDFFHGSYEEAADNAIKYSLENLI